MILLLQYLPLLLICLASWYLSLCSNEFELFAPVPIAFLGFTVSILLAIVGLTSWNTYTLSARTWFIVLTGFIAMSLAGLSVSMVEKRYLVYPQHMKHSISLIVIDKTKSIIIILIVVLAIVIRIIESYRLGADLGIEASSYADLSQRLRHAISTLYSTNAVKEGIGFSLVERELEKCVNMIGFIAAFLAANSIKDGYSANERKSLVFPVIILLLCSIFQILSGGRGMIFYWVISFFVYLSFHLYKDNHIERRKDISFRLLMAGIVFGVFVAIFMYFAGGLVGRKARSSIIEYVSFYFGGSIPSLSILCDSILPTESIANGPTYVFHSVYLLLLKVHLINELPAYSVFWVDCGGHTSNIFTCFGRYYVGYGLLGTFLLSFLSMVLLTIFYRWARYRNTPELTVLAGYLCAYTFDCAREEFLFSRLIGSTQIINVLLLIVLTKFITHPDSLHNYINTLHNYINRVVSKVHDS